MKTKRLRRIYHFNDAQLVTTTKQKVAFMERDAARFAGYGITQSNFDALLQKAAAFADLKTLAELKGSQKEITQNKKAKRLELTAALENVRHKAALKFKKGSAVYKAFHRGNLMLEKDSALFLTAKVSVKLAAQYLPELAAHGLNTAMINQISILNVEYVELIIAQQSAQHDTSEHTNECILLGNEIYTELMRYTTLGMAIWNTESAARYNDYIIYDVKRNAKAS